MAELKEIWELRDKGNTLAPTLVPDTEIEEENNLIGASSQLPRLNMNYNVNRGPSGNGNLGMIAPQKPYVIITRPELSLPSNYGHYHGYPSNITTGLNSLIGYTEVANIHLDNIGCTNIEERMIDRLLHDGVIIRNWTVNKPNEFTLYTNNSDSNVIGKDLTTLKTLPNVLLKDRTSVTNPVFTLSNVDDVIARTNYIYYPQLDRYYIVKEILSVRNGLWDVMCEVDVLETYKRQIGNQSAVISRQEYNYNLYLNDGTLKAYSKPFQIVKEFPISFNNTGRTYIIVGAGGAPGTEQTGE